MSKILNGYFEVIFKNENKIFAASSFSEAAEKARKYLNMDFLKAINYYEGEYASYLLTNNIPEELKYFLAERKELVTVKPLFYEEI
jgi:hypothetical protein